MAEQPRIDVEVFHETALEWRDIEPGNACSECGGAGITFYSDTSTWRHGIGGQAMTTDVCDKCWGSGDRTRPWPNWRLIKRVGD